MQPHQIAARWFAYGLLFGIGLSLVAYHWLAVFFHILH
jgi:hypothetical protein